MRMVEPHCHWTVVANVIFPMLTLTYVTNVKTADVIFFELTHGVKPLNSVDVGILRTLAKTVRAHVVCHWEVMFL